MQFGQKRGKYQRKLSAVIAGENAAVAAFLRNDRNFGVDVGDKRNARITPADNINTPDEAGSVDDGIAAFDVGIGVAEIDYQRIGKGVAVFGDDAGGVTPGIGNINMVQELFKMAFSACRAFIRSFKRKSSPFSSLRRSFSS